MRKIWMKNFIVRTTCLFAAFAITAAYAWDPKEIEERHAKAE
jgi:hypothetical protein